MTPLLSLLSPQPTKPALKTVISIKLNPIDLILPIFSPNFY